MDSEKAHFLNLIDEPGFVWQPASVRTHPHPGDFQVNKHRSEFLRMRSRVRRNGLVSAVATLLLVGVAAPTAMAAPSATPANDDFANAAVLSVGGSDSSTLAGATFEPGEPAEVELPSIWWSITPQSSGAVVIEVSGGDGELDFQVFEGSQLSDLYQIASGYGAGTTFEAEAGSTYFVRVATWGSPGSVSISADVVVAPVNDGFANASVLGVGATDSGTLTGATFEAGEPDDEWGGEQPSIWWSISSPADEHLLVGVDGSGNETLEVFEGTQLSNLTVIPSGYTPENGSITFLADAGVTYFVRVTSWQAYGAVEVRSEVYVPPPPPANDDFENAAPLGVGAPLTSTTVGATRQPGEPGDFMSLGTVWWSTTTSTRTLLSVDITDHTLYILNVYEGGDFSELSQVASGFLNPAEFYAEPGITYYFQVMSADSRDITIEASVGAEKSGYTAVAPTRLLDSRNGTGGYSSKWASGADRALQIGGVAPVPAGVSAVAVNLTATETTAAGHATLYPGSSPRPQTSSLNWSAGKTIANQAIVPVDETGQIRIYNRGGSSHLILDVVGFFAEGDGELFDPVEPARVFDSRDGTGTSVGKFGRRETREIQVAGEGGVPADATAAVMNLTAVGSSGSGYALAYASDGPVPGASTVNWEPNETAPNHAIVPLGADGKMKVYSRTSEPVDLFGDVVGWYGPGAGSGFVPVEPERILDSREDVGTFDGPWSAREERDISAIDVIPYEATSLVMNATATNTTKASYLTAWSGWYQRPGTSNLNWVAGMTRANLVTTPVGDGEFRLRNNVGVADFIWVRLLCKELGGGR